MMAHKSSAVLNHLIWLPLNLEHGRLFNPMSPSQEPVLLPMAKSAWKSVGNFKQWNIVYIKQLTIYNCIQIIVKGSSSSALCSVCPSHSFYLFLCFKELLLLLELLELRLLQRFAGGRSVERCWKQTAASDLDSQLPHSQHRHKSKKLNKTSTTRNL